MSYALELYRHDPLLLAQRWLRLPNDELKRTAFRAAHEGHLETLCQLTFAHLTAFGEAGAAISDHTLRSYKTSIRQFIAYCSNQAVSVLRAGPEDGRLWIRGLEKAGKAPATVRVRLAGVRAMYRALRWSMALQGDPFIDVKPARDLTPPWEKRSPYAHQEVEQLLGAAQPPLRRLILLCAHAGLRISEALNLRHADLTSADGILTVREGKGKKTRRVVMSKTLQAALPSKEALPEASVVGLSYQASRHALKALCTLTSTPYRAWHALRHYTGTRLIRETGDLDRVARHLGHADLATARIYAKWSEDALHSTVGQW